MACLSPSLMGKDQDYIFIIYCFIRIRMKYNLAQFSVLKAVFTKIRPTMNFDLMKMGGTLSQGTITTENFCNFASIGRFKCKNVPAEIGFNAYVIPILH